MRPSCRRAISPRRDRHRRRPRRHPDPPWAADARTRSDRRERPLGPGQQGEWVLIAELVAFGADAQVQAAVTRRQRADRRAGVDHRAGANGDRPQRQVADTARAAAYAHHAEPRDAAGMHDRPAARGADRRAGRRGEIDAPVRARRERRVARVVEGARHLAWDRSQPSLGLGGGGDRQRRQNRDQD